MYWRFSSHPSVNWQTKSKIPQIFIDFADIVQICDVPVNSIFFSQFIWTILFVSKAINFITQENAPKSTRKGVATDFRSFSFFTEFKTFDEFL